MIEHRSADIGDTRLISSELPAGSHLVRLFPTPGESYDRMIVVSEQDGGTTLFLSGWIGDPLTHGEWRAGLASLFPRARIVRWERRQQDGTVRQQRLSLSKTPARR